MHLRNSRPLGETGNSRGHHCLDEALHGSLRFARDLRVGVRVACPMYAEAWRFELHAVARLESEARRRLCGHTRSEAYSEHVRDVQLRRPTLTLADRAGPRGSCRGRRHRLSEPLRSVGARHARSFTSTMRTLTRMLSKIRRHNIPVTIKIQQSLNRSHGQRMGRYARVASRTDPRPGDLIAACRSLQRLALATNRMEIIVCNAAAPTHRNIPAV
jgi:hypothetical protein